MKISDLDYMSTANTSNDVNSVCMGMPLQVYLLEESIVKGK